MIVINVGRAYRVDQILTQDYERSGVRTYRPGADSGRCDLHLLVGVDRVRD